MTMNIPPLTFGSFKNGIPGRNVKDRYWKFLFDNLQRAVDELYATCEADENILQCKEVAMVLETCTKDFHDLTERFKMLQSFEQTDSDNRPSSLAWEIRKSVPMAKNCDISPRRPNNRLTKLTLFTVNCPATCDVQADSSGKNQEMLPEVSPIILEASSNLPNDKCDSTSMQLSINVSETNDSSLEITPNENKITTEEGEWRVVKANKRNRLLRKSNQADIPSEESSLKISNPTLCENGGEPAPKTEPASEPEKAFHIDMTPLTRSRTSTLSNSDHAKLKPLVPFFEMGESALDMDLSIELDEALISALTAEDELNNELREELDASLGGVEDQDFTDDQSDSWLSTSADSVRIPGRSVELHEKLLSPARRSKSDRANERVLLAEQLAEKQMKVTELREQRQKDKIERCALLSKRVEEVRTWKNEILQEKRRAIEGKLQAAEQRRLNQLQMIAKKAHDEEAKGSEIAFINNIGAESKRQEIQVKYQLWRNRLLELADEQNKRREATAARKSAAFDKRKALDAERKNRMQELLEKQKERERKAEEHHVEKLQKRVAISRAREREHEERMTQIRIADEERKQELRERIHHKQDECARRHTELIEQRRERAVALSAQSTNAPSPRQVLTNKPSGGATPLLVDLRKYCTTCCLILDSDVVLLEHLKSRKHRQLCGTLKSNSHTSFLTFKSMQPIISLSLTQQQHLSASVNSGNESKLADGLENNEATAVENRQGQKKRAKKYRQRLLDCLPRSDQMNSMTVPAQNKLSTAINDIDRMVEMFKSSQDMKPDRILATEKFVLEALRLIELQSVKDKLDFYIKFLAMNGFSVLNKLLSKCLTLHLSLQQPNQPSTNSKKKSIPPVNVDRLIITVFQCFIHIFFVKPTSTAYFVCHESSTIPLIFELLMNDIETLALTATNSLQLHGPVFDSVHSRLKMTIACVGAFFEYLGACTNRFPTDGSVSVYDKTVIQRRSLDCVNLLVTMGFIEKTSQIVAVAIYLTAFDESVYLLLRMLTSLLGAVCRLMQSTQPSDADASSDKMSDDSLLLFSALRYSDLCGIVSLAYGMILRETGFGRLNQSGEHLLLSATNSNSHQRPSDVPNHSAELAVEAFGFISAAAVLNPLVLQSTLASDSPLLLQFRQASAYILSQANTSNLTENHVKLLNEIIICVGLFAVLNHSLAENILTAGQPPTILQQLCQLPIKYFTDPDLMTILIPTLIAATYQCDDCLTTLKAELSPLILIRYLEDQTQLKRDYSTLGSIDLDKTPLSFADRFPKRCWSDAINWFKASLQPTEKKD